MVVQDSAHEEEGQVVGGPEEQEPPARHQCLPSTIFMQRNKGYNSALSNFLQVKI